MNIIAAIAKNHGIGYEGQVPWYLPQDLKYLKNITTGAPPGKFNAVIMGRLTWESIPTKYRPLKNRLNLVVASQSVPDNHLVFPSLDTAIQYAQRDEQVDQIFIVGGQRIYQEAILRPDCQKLYLTRLNKDFTSDTYFPEINGNHYQMESVSNTFEDNEIKYNFVTYQRAEHDHAENQYLDMLKKIINQGNERPDRTGVGVKSLFGCQMRYDISKYFPLLTTKRVFLKGIIEELLWFLRGDTDAKTLQKKGVKIWDGNTSREFLDNYGLTHLEEGDIGAGYGFQFRHFGAQYQDCHTDYTGQGVDQVAEVLRLIREEPSSRRIIINLWNPSDLKKAVLPPCHAFYQFYVQDGKLSLSMYQRSGDMGLGVPFNIASASLMVYVFAKLTNLQPGELVHSIGDAHIYLNHLDAIKIQIERTPRPFPILEMNDEKEYRNVEDFEFKDFSLKGYYPHESIRMQMAV